jgi:hypothetical protein
LLEVFILAHDIFVSKPSTLNLDELQSKFCANLDPIFKGRGLKLRSLGTEDYSNKAPLLAVLQLMSKCDGVIVLGFKQIKVESYIEKEGTDRANKRSNIFLPTAWNHLEAGIAFGLNLPILIIKEKGVEGGIFDQGSTGKFIHQVDFSNDKYLQSEEFLQPFNEWHEEIILFYWKRKKEDFSLI